MRPDYDRIGNAALLWALAILALAAAGWALFG